MCFTWAFPFGLRVVQQTSALERIVLGVILASQVNRLNSRVADDLRDIEGLTISYAPPLQTPVSPTEDGKLAIHLRTTQKNGSLY